MLSAIIIDDEKAGYNNLAKLLNEFHPEVKLVGKATNVKTGVEVIRKLEPEILFLDVELTDGTAFDLLEQIKAEDHRIIFNSSYSKHALRAFDFAAMGFLTKPPRAEKLEEALTRAKLYFEQRDKLQRLEDIAEVRETIEEQKLPKRLGISNTDGFHLIEIGDVEFIDVDRSLVEIHEESRKVTYVSGNLIEYVRRLRPYKEFKHISARSPLINCDKVVKIDGDQVLFRSGTSVQLPYGKGSDLKNWLGWI